MRSVVPAEADPAEDSDPLTPDERQVDEEQEVLVPANGDAVLAHASKSAPDAVAETKRLMLRAAGPTPMPDLLDYAADCFANAVRGPEGREGTRAFVEKRKPSWVVEVE